MNFKEHLEIFVNDLNFVCSIQSLDGEKIDNIFRLKVLILHLHLDFLLSEIITNSFQHINKSFWSTTDMEFKEKLRIIYATKDFDEGFFNTLKTINTLRNNLAHNLMINEDSERDRIKSLEIDNKFKDSLKRGITLTERLVLSCITYTNCLIEYLHGVILNEDMDYRIIINNKFQFYVEKIKRE